MSKELFKCAFKNPIICVYITSYFSLSILLIVPASLQDIFGNIGVPRNSPTKASTCFLSKGVNSTEVGLPIPKFSSK
nr:MAG TPA: hypothetical protein [Caudoviricetes sp.]